jgi:hypothetical protein
MKVSVKSRISRHADFLEHLLRREIAARRIVLMQRMHRHAPRHRARRLRQFRAKDVMPLVRDPNPIHRAQHNRLPRPEDDHPPAPQRQFIKPLHLIIRHRRAQRRRCIDIKSGELNRRLSNRRKRRKKERDEECEQFHEEYDSRRGRHKMG